MILIYSATVLYDIIIPLSIVECPVVNNLGDDRALLPDSNIDVSTDYEPIVGNQHDVREVWCASGTDSTPTIILTFTEPLYIVYATTRGTSIYWIRDYSYYFVNSFGRRLYSNVDGQSVCVSTVCIEAIIYVNICIVLYSTIAKNYIWKSFSFTRLY